MHVCYKMSLLSSPACFHLFRRDQTASSVPQLSLNRMEKYATNEYIRQPTNGHIRPGPSNGVVSSLVAMQIIIH